MLKPVLVTGASSGIGAATARRLAQTGFRVFAAARRLDKLEALAASAPQGAIRPLQMDVTDEGAVERGFQDIAADGATLYGVVNNAGFSVTGPIECVPTNEWRRQYETNVFGLANVLRAATPILRAQGTGRIVNISSVAGRIVTPFFGVYASSKHAVDGLSDALRRELAPFGVAVSIVRPGFINTPIGEGEQDGLAPYMEPNNPYAKALGVFQKWHAAKHPNAPSPDIVAQVVEKALTAACPKSHYIVPPRFAALIALRTFLPTSIVDRIVARTIGLPNA
ncbi:MAG: SDR family oxidoreductase [Pseudomonadota bacterium]